MMLYPVEILKGHDGDSQLYDDSDLTVLQDNQFYLQFLVSDEGIHTYIHTHSISINDSKIDSKHVKSGKDTNQK